MARNSNGQWKKGTSGNPNGRPRKQVEERYLEAIRKAVSIEDLKKIFETGLHRARAGDIGWARLICEYLVGKPTQYVATDVTTNGQSFAAVFREVLITKPDETVDDK